ncbi:MAG: ABC transporter substrate-binding protein [Rhodocyclaceae bacterium]|nr:ABC transporter substrate-binding protein [Rhodocyclaceae bacterium]
MSLTPKRNLAGIAVAVALAAGAGLASAQQMGVSKDEVVIGSIQDLSGPLAGFGKQLRFGMQQRVDEINETGGINGRKLKLVFEDSGYDPKKGLLAAQKLVQQDKIFAMVGTLGTAVAMASMPTLFEKNVLHLFPLTAAREMYEPLHKLKYSFAAPYFDQMRNGVKWMVKERGAKKFCIIYQDDDFGVEVLKGAEQGLKEINQAFAEKTTFKRGATDFSAQVAKMKSAGCDTVVLGTIIRETIGTIGESRKTGFNPQFLGSSAAYTDLIHKLGGKAMDGLYATMQVGVPYMDDPSKNVREWGARYKAKFNEDPALFSSYGYVAVDLFYQTAKKAGPNLTTDSFVKTLEATTFARDMFGSPEYKFTPTQHLGNARSRVSQIQNGRWVNLTDYLD